MAVRLLRILCVHVCVYMAGLILPAVAVSSAAGATAAPPSGFRVISQTTEAWDGDGNRVGDRVVQEPMAVLDDVVLGISDACLMDGPCAGALCVDQGDALATALKLAGETPEAACIALFPLFAAPYMPHVSHATVSAPSCVN